MENLGLILLGIVIGLVIYRHYFHIVDEGIDKIKDKFR